LTWGKRSRISSVAIRVHGSAIMLALISKISTISETGVKTRIWRAKNTSKTPLFALISHENGLISCHFAYFVTRLRARICVCCAVTAHIAAYAFNRTLGRSNISEGAGGFNPLKRRRWTRPLGPGFAHLSGFPESNPIQFSPKLRPQPRPSGSNLRSAAGWDMQ